MTSAFASGEMVRGILQSGDITTAAPVVLYDQATGAAVTLATGNVFVIYAILVSNGDSASVITIFDDADGDGVVDTGETIFKQSMAANVLSGFTFERGFGLTRVPKAKASAASANTSITILGEVIK